jgi:hypothetical protein
MISRLKQEEVETKIAPSIVSINVLVTGKARSRTADVVNTAGAEAPNTYAAGIWVNPPTRTGGRTTGQISARPSTQVPIIPSNTQDRSRSARTRSAKLPLATPKQIASRMVVERSESIPRGSVVERTSIWLQRPE